MVLNISSLPPEVLRHIFQFLNAHDRLTISRVCKKWLNAINCRQLLRDIEIYFYENIDEGINLFRNMTRQFRWFWFCSITIDDSVLEFLQKYSNQFITLFFVKCKVNLNIYGGRLPCTLLQCDNVKHLSIRDCNVIALFASLPNVAILEFDSYSYLTDYIVFQLNKSIFKLESLSLGSNKLYDEVSKSVYGINETEMNPLNSLSFASIIMLLENNRNTLRTIDLSEMKLSPSAVQTISEIKGLKLRSAKYCFNLEAKYIRNFCKNQMYLTSINFSSLYQVTDETVCAFGKYLPNLQELIIKDNTLIDNCVIEIFQLEQLELLDLSHSVNISELSYREAISNLKAFQLKHLNLMNSNISDESLFELLKCNQNILYLNVSHTNISNKTLNMICKNLILLEHLILNSCKEISDVGLTGEFEPHSDSFTPTPLSNLKNLGELDLCSNPSITNTALLKAIRFRSLEHLFLTQSDISDDFIIQMKKHNPRLNISNMSC